MITKRLQEYFQFKGLSYYEVEKQIEVSTGSISGAVKQGRNIGSRSLQKILLIYTDLSAEWLLRGEGEMLLTEEKTKDWLIDRILIFFGLSSKPELISFFERIYAAEAPGGTQLGGKDPLETLVLEIIERNYGGTLRNAEELYAMYLQKIMREGENMLGDDTIKGEEGMG